MTTQPKIKGFVETSFLDWPGKVASVVFLGGCNFRCRYCHNHRLVTEPDALSSWSLDGLLNRLEHFRGWIDGVCVTGGEPTFDPGLEFLLRTFRSRGWGIKLDTNGSRPKTLEGLIRDDLVDAVALDVKAPLESIPYRRNAGAAADPAAVRRSLEVLAAAGLSVEVRTTIHPHLLSREELVRLSMQVGTLLGRGNRGGCVRFTPQRCRVEDPLDPDLRHRPALDPEVFERWAQEARKMFSDAYGRQGNRTL